MDTQRGIVQIVGAFVYLALLSLGLVGASRLQQAAQAHGSAAYARGYVLALAGLGVLIVAFTLWARHRALAAGLVAVALTLVHVVQGPFPLVSTPRWLLELWWTLGFARGTIVAAVAWGAALAVLVPALARPRERPRMRARAGA